jgi:hypothetical protein
VHLFDVPPESNTISAEAKPLSMSRASVPSSFVANPERHRLATGFFDGRSK